jgi:hypothetical protein
MFKKLFPVVVALLLAPSLLQADVQDRLYDFTDAYYRKNGINPLAIAAAGNPVRSPPATPPSFRFNDRCARC